MRMWLLAIPAAMVLAHGACAEGVQLALDGAADLSPVYPTVTLPANAREFVVIFSYGDHKTHHIRTGFEPIDAKGSYTINSVGDVKVAAVGDATRFLLRESFLSDIPVGRWTLTASVDDKPVGTVEITVVPAAAPLKLSSPIALAGSLAAGTEWNFQFRFLQEPRPGLKLTLDGIESADPDGWIKTTLLRKIVAQDAGGVRWDQQRTGKLVSTSWVVATDKGIAVAKIVADGNETAFEPLELVLRTPGDAFHQQWEWRPKGAPPEAAQNFQMWGPVPVKTPQGEQPGYVVLQQIPDEDDPTKVGLSVESQIVPGTGLVHEVDVQPIPGTDAALRDEIDLIQMTRGSGPEPEVGKFVEGSGQ